LSVAGLHTAQLVVIALVVASDQASKLVVRRALELGESVTVIPGLLDLTRVHNSGLAFGLMNGLDLPFQSTLLALVPACALVALAVYGLQLVPGQRLTRVGLSIVIGGAIGNLIDRVTAGFVLDFVDLYWRGWHFWAFNVADAAINVGAGLMILDLLRPGRHGVSRTL
jgi:signal peptidase II